MVLLRVHAKFLLSFEKKNSAIQSDSSFIFHFHFELFIHKIPSAYKNKVSLIILHKKRKILRANRIADLPGSRVLFGFQLIKYVFSYFLNWHKVGSSLILIGISFQTLRAE